MSSVTDSLSRASSLDAPPVTAPTAKNQETVTTAVLNWAKNNPRLVTIGGAFLVTTKLWTSPPVSYVVIGVGVTIVVGATVWQCYRGPVKRPNTAEHQD